MIPTLFWNWLYSCKVALVTAWSKLNKSIQKFKPKIQIFLDIYVSDKSTTHKANKTVKKNYWWPQTL